MIVVLLLVGESAISRTSVKVQQQYSIPCTLLLCQANFGEMQIVLQSDVYFV